MLTCRDIRKLCEDYALTHPNDYFYCLVDHAGMPGLHRKLIHTKADWVSLFEGRKEANALQAAPLLFQIQRNPNDPRHGGLLSWVGERGTYTSSLLFIASPLPLQDLSGRLARRLDAIVSEEMDVLLRYYDPRVFEQLMHVLSVPEKDAFLSLASRWWFADRRGELQAIDAGFAVEDCLASPLVLSALQEATLIDASEPDQVAEQLAQHVPNEYCDLPLPERYDFIICRMTEARQFGIKPTHELALYCALALRHGKGFASNPPWSTIFDHVAAGRTCLAEAILT